MKPFTFFIVLMSLFFSFRPNSEIEFTHGEKCKEILDSANILVQTGEFSINWEPKIQDKDRELKISRWFERKSFSELLCLLESSYKLYQFYGYLYADMLYSDSLQNKYSYLFNDTTSVQFNRPNGLVDSKMTLGTLIKFMSEQIGKVHHDLSKQPLVEDTIKSFIKIYSKYPNSYKPISFLNFSMGSDDTGLTNFTESHFYQIENNIGQVVKVTSAFVLDSNLNINVIEKDSTSFISSDPPRLKDWLTDYGRPLSNSDSINLRLK